MLLALKVNHLTPFSDLEGMNFKLDLKDRKENGGLGRQGGFQYYQW